MRKVTKEYIKEVFDECNRLYFDNQLKNCKFTVFKTIHCNGFCYHKEVNGKIHGRIGISSNTIWTEETFREMVIHEMIHLYNLQIDHVHGSWFWHSRHFRRKLKELNKKYGLNVTICNPNIYQVNEKVPSTFFGKLMRRIRFELKL
jgi:geranylgeranyl pyrophosphate synthase